MNSRLQSIWMYLCYAIAFAGLGFNIYSRIPKITNYPLPISWSESGRIFNAYQIYAPLISGEHLSWPWLDPAKSILDGLVLLIPSAQIWMYRFWVNFLFLFCAAVVSFAVVKKAISFSPLYKEKAKRGITWLLVLLGTLFLLQGPVYYHVLLGIVAVLWLYDVKKPFFVLFLIMLGSIWEGLCRVNWFIMPALVASLIYVFTKPFSEKKPWQYFRWPLAYLLTGAVTSFLTYFIFINVTGYAITFLNPHMDYPFFLYKLWPNDGFVGLIPGIVLICLPLLLVILYVALKHIHHLHWVRLFTITGILTILFAGSTVVSMRAGGGYDLHNFDSLLLLLFICACFFGLDAISRDNVKILKKISPAGYQKGEPDYPRKMKPISFAHLRQRFDLKTNDLSMPLANVVTVFCLLLIPMFSSFSQIHAPLPQIADSDAVIQQVNSIINEFGQRDRPVLFIDQRQLLVYKKITQMSIFVPYDKIELMEMAMARNSEYENQFLSDIKNQKFSLIVSEVLFQWEKSFTNRDWYENNVWVNAVSLPISTYYEPVFINKDIDLAIYAPK